MHACINVYRQCNVKGRKGQDKVCSRSKKKNRNERGERRSDVC